MNKTVKQFFLMGTVTLLTACGGGSSGGGTLSNLYDGRWATVPACGDDSDTNPVTMVTTTESVKASLTLQGSTGKLDVTTYPTNDCSGNGENLSAALSLTYGDDVPDASSVCSNTKKVDINIDSVTSSSMGALSASQIEALRGDELSGVQAFGLLCTSSDGTRLYFGDEGANSGETEATRPTMIDPTFFLSKQVN